MSKRQREEDEQGQSIKEELEDNKSNEVAIKPITESVEPQEEVKKQKIENENKQELSLKEEEGLKKVEIVKKEAEDNKNKKEKEGKKKKVAIIFGYCGLDYQGLQRNPGARTIEDDLEKALFEAGAILKENLGNMNKINWVRGCRTDKGVHAIGNIISVKIQLVEKVNSLLPSAIRVFTIQRTLGAFHCKNAIDYRVYEYLCPTFAFLPILRAKEGKLDAELLAKVRDFFTIYEGTHNYHNFTIQMKPDDPTGNRHIRSITCSDPFEVEGIEVVRITLVGQSFILHQIRKMIGLVIFCSRHSTTEKIILHTLNTKENLHFMMAPGEFLYLNRCAYNAYNRKLKNLKSPFPEIDMTLYDKEREEFIHKHVFPPVMAKEKKESLMRSYVNKLDTSPLIIDTKEVDLWKWIKDTEQSPIQYARKPRPSLDKVDWK